MQLVVALVAVWLPVKVPALVGDEGLVKVVLAQWAAWLWVPVVPLEVLLTVVVGSVL